MADQDNLKKKRTLAKAKLIRTIRSLQQLLANTNYSVEEVTKAFDDFHNTWIRLGKRHDNHMEALEGDDDSSDDA